MVARPQSPEAPDRSPARGLVASVFGHWHAAVDRVARAVASAPWRSGAGAAMTATWRFVVRPSEVMATDDPRPGGLASRTGYACLAAGAVAAALVTFLGRQGGAAAATDALWLVMWAGARYAVMRLASGDVLRTRTSALTVAWAGGLVPLILAATPLLHAAALVASAALTWRALRAAGVPRREASAVVGWGFGGQAAVEVLAWIVRGGLIYGLLLNR
jgi:hypothetical protein